MPRWSTSLAEQPILEHDGRHCQRQAGTWVDVATHMKVPVSLSQQLDGLAKLNSALWCLDTSLRRRRNRAIRVTWNGSSEAITSRSSATSKAVGER